MPRRSGVDLLPELVRADLNSRLIAGSFSGYDALAEWLASKGYALSRSALHRYGQAFEERMQALKLSTEQARALVAETPDDEGAMSEALLRLTQEKIFGVLLELNLDPDTVDFPKLARSIAELTKAGVVQRKHAVEMRKQVLAEVDGKIKALDGGSRKLDAETLAFVRQAIRGD